MKEIIMKILDFAMSAGLKLVGAVLVVALGFVLTNKLVKLLEKGKGFEKNGQKRTGIFAELHCCCT